MAGANVKPLTHWAIYKGCTLRFRSRAAERVTGVLTGADGAGVPFAYAPETLTLHVGGEVIRLNEYGWEVERWAESQGAS